MKTAKHIILCRQLVFVILLMTCVGTYAQTEDRDAVVPDTTRTVVPDASILFEVPNLAYAISPALSPMSLMPGVYGGFWPIHQGLNAQIGMELSVGWGKYAPRGVGLGQNVAAVYAQPLGKRLVIAGGIFATNMDWGNYHQTEAGVGAMMSYRLTDRVSLFAYGIKSFAPHDDSQCFAPRIFAPNMGDRIGVGADFKIGNAASITVAFEHRSGPGAYLGPIALPPMKPYGQE